MERRKAGLAFPRAWNKVDVTTFKPIKGVPRTIIIIAFFPTARYSGSALNNPRSCSVKR